jgi:hypothetical protein
MEKKASSMYALLIDDPEIITRSDRFSSPQGKEKKSKGPQSDLKNHDAI